MVSVVQTAQANAEIRTDRRATTIAEMIVVLFAAQIRWWIASERPDASEWGNRAFEVKEASGSC